MANRAIKYRLYPNTKQQILFAKTFGCCRKVYNLMLADKIKSYEETKSFGKQTPAQYKIDYPYLKEVDSLALSNVQLHLQQALHNCFSHKHCKFPIYKSAKRSRKTYTTNNQHGTIAILNQSIKLPKVGAIKAKIHRKPCDHWLLKSATISQDRDGKFYVSILFEFDAIITPIAKDTTNAIGLDYKSDGLYMDSNGIIGSNHKYYRNSHKKLAKAQRILSRRQDSSQNYKKQQQKVAKIHKHIANQRLNHLHQLSTEIANQYDIVCVETLNMKAMSNKGFGNGKATLDNGYGLFLTILEYKLVDRGKYLIKIDKWYPSSQICSCCGAQQKIPLSNRIYTCNCGFIKNRDQNAALNILKEGLKLFKKVV